jgi:PilZ domain
MTTMAAIGRMRRRRIEDPMIYRFEQMDEEQLASLAKEVRVRVLNCSGNGCLLETNAAIPVGAVARLRIGLGGNEFDDTVRIVRCQELAGAGSVYHVGIEFLATTPPYAGTLRYLMRRELNRLVGWLTTNEPN